MKDAFTADTLDRLVPPADDAVLDWSDVLDRAQITRRSADIPNNGHQDLSALVVGARRARRRRSRTRLTVAAALVVGTVVVAAATPVGAEIAHTFANFGAWISGQPGRPAPAAQQRAFEQERRTWLSFPGGSDLRRLIQTTIAGTTFTLDGFRTSDSLCLDLEVTGKTTGATTTCAPLSDLKARKQPVLIVDVDEPFGSVKVSPVQVGPDMLDHHPRSAVTIGIVADGIHNVEIAGDGRTEHALVAGDAFMAVIDEPKVAYRTTEAWVTTANGARIAIPLAQSPLGIGGGARMPTTTGGKLHGPSKVQLKVVGGRIGWLDRREPVGLPAPHTRLLGLFGGGSKFLFERQVSPDPNSLYKIIVSLRFGTLGNGAINRYYGLKPPKPTNLICYTLLGRHTAGGGCNSYTRLFARGPVSVGVELDGGGQQYETFHGLASDAVERITLFLGTGEQVAVPLRDNAFIAQVSRAKYPVRLVAYDNQNRTIYVKTFAGDSLAGQQPLLAAKWRTIITASSKLAGPANVLVAHESNGQTCTEFHYGTRGDSLGGCRPKKWEGPPLQLNLDGPFNPQHPSDRTPAFLSGWVRPDIRSITVRLSDGTILHPRIIEGLVLIALSPNTPVNTRLRAVTGYNSKGQPVAKQCLTPRR